MKNVNFDDPIDAAAVELVALWAAGAVDATDGGFVDGYPVDDAIVRRVLNPAAVARARDLDDEGIHVDRPRGIAYVYELANGTIGRGRKTHRLTVARVVAAIGPVEPGTTPRRSSGTPAARRSGTPRRRSISR